jgi:hypothetical protein
MTEVIQLTPLEARQIEVDTYAANIVMYQALLATLDGNWDKDLIHLKDIEATRSRPSMSQWTGSNALAVSATIRPSN